MTEDTRAALLKLDELVRIHARGDCDHTGGQTVCLWAIRDALSALLASLPPSSPPAEPYAKVREVFTAAGRCRWHDTLLVQMISGPHVGSYFCAVCAVEGRSTFDGAAPASPLDRQP